MSRFVYCAECSRVIRNFSLSLIYANSFNNKKKLFSLSCNMCRSVVVIKHRKIKMKKKVDQPSFVPRQQQLTDFLHLLAIKNYLIKSAFRFDKNLHKSTVIARLTLLNRRECRVMTCCEPVDELRLCTASSRCRFRSFKSSLHS